MTRYLRTVSSLLPLTFVCVGLSGCAEDPYVSAESYSTPNDPFDNAIKHVAGQPRSVSRDTILFADEKIDVPADPDISLRVTSGRSGKSIEIANNVPIGLFKPGYYRTDKDSIIDSDVGFFDALKKVVASVETQLHQSGKRYEVCATYTGSSDGMAIHYVVYGGEFGGKVSQMVAINGKPPVLMTIESGQQVNNEELAALRAISLSYLVNNIIDGDFKPRQVFQANTSPIVGQEWRSVRVEFRLVSGEAGA